MLVKIHESYRKIVAVCDAELIGKKFIEGNIQLDLTSEFYGGKKMKETEVIEILKGLNEDDSTFNIVGKKSVAAAIKAGIIDKSGVMKIKGIPHALGLL